MNTEKKSLSLPKKFGLALLFALLYFICFFALAILQNTFPSSIYWVFSFKEALMALSETPVMFIITFAFAVLIGLLQFYFSGKYKISALLYVSSAIVSLALCLGIILVFYELDILAFACLFIIGLLPFIIMTSIRFGKIKYKHFNAVICIILSFTILTSSFFSLKAYIKNAVGEPDRTSSWYAINQALKRGDDWKQIVKDSKFQLGEIETVTEDDVTDYYQSIGTYPALDGSTVCVPMAMEFARQHLGFDDENSGEFADFSTTHHAYEYLTDYVWTRDYYYIDKTSYEHIYIKEKPVDLILATEPSDAELEMAKKAGVTLVKKPICYDAFVFITHKDNPIESLTIKQIQDIYTGKITNWKELGGKDEKIKAFQREANSGSQTAMENLVMGGKDMIPPTEIAVVEGMGELIDEVAEYRNATSSIGYTYRYYIDTLYKNDNIKTIAIEGISPTDENIRSGEYPFSTNYYGVIRGGEEDKTGGKFLDWILSDEGQRCIEQAGYIPMK